MKNKNPFDLSSDMLRDSGEELNKLSTSLPAWGGFILISIICIFMLVSLIRANQLKNTDLARSRIWLYIFWILWFVCLIDLLLWNF